MNAMLSFHIGTISHPKCSDSHGHSKGRWKGNWSANCVNHWVATLGNKLNLENSIALHNIIVLHELTHVLSEIESPHDWDEFLGKIVSETKSSKGKRMRKNL